MVKEFIKKYPLTVLMIIFWIVGGIWFGSHIIFDKVEEASGRGRAQEVIEQMDPSGAFAGLPVRAQAQVTGDAAPPAGTGSVFTKVNVSYFDDACFIGDSRTDTLRLYSGWTKPAYYTKTGTNIWDIMDDTVQAGDGGAEISIDKALQAHKFGKVYIMLGVNELGTGTPESYYQQFRKVVDRIRQLQPDALIFVESIIHVTDAEQKAQPAINNDAINSRNTLLKKLADNKKTFYIDANEVLDDKNGCLNASYTFDGVHLKGDQVGPWLDFLLAHGVVRK